jgi:hypothetical protein
VHPLDRQEKIPPGSNGQLDQEEGFILPWSQSEGLECTKELSEAQEPMRGGKHHSSDVRTWVQIQACLWRQKGRLITSQRLLVTAFWGEACLSGSGSRAEVLCYVKVCETSPRSKGG